MHYRFLTEADTTSMYTTFMEAFADYFVPMQMSEEQFLAHLKHEGVKFELSVGAFEGGEMVGLLLHGLDRWQGTLTVYNAGTGVLPAQRGKGVAGAMFKYALPTLKASGVRQCLLEVIQANEAARKVYRRLGFAETRPLECVALSQGQAVLKANKEADIPIKPIRNPDWAHLQTFWDWYPAWQNSISTVRRSWDQLQVLGAFVGQACVGYGIIAPASGRIFQLAVDQAYRRKGIGSRLLGAFQERPGPAKPLSMINIDGSAERTLAFFHAHGFEKTVAQHEMALVL
jgi:ribosomal protein S18 acetylase RimI-like enzyme